MGTGVGVRKTLIELFKDNKTLLETIPNKTIDAFVQLLLEVGKDAKYFLTTTFDNNLDY